METIWFDFSKKDRLQVDNLEIDIEFTIYNVSKSSLIIESQSGIQKFDNGWVDIGYLYMNNNNDRMQIVMEEEINNMEGVFNLSKLEMDFDPGRYRIIITVMIIDEDSGLYGKHKIGKVFWIEEQKE